MKQKVKRTREEEIEAVVIEINLPREIIDEHTPAIPSQFVTPFLTTADGWAVRVEIDTGKIHSWPTDGGHLDLYCCPRDSGTYRLYGDAGQELAAIVNGYVPNGIVPGEYGDYIGLKIDATGKISNWPEKPDISAFFPDGEDD